MIGSTRSVLLVFACLALWHVTVAAQDEPFKKGMSALDDHKWSDAARFMKEAIGLDPKESTRKVGARLLLGGDEYLPHFFLAEALFNQGDCAAALIAWEESERQGVIRRVERRLGDLRKGVAECEGKGFLTATKLAAERERAAAAIKDATAAEQEFTALQKSHPEITATEWRPAAERGRADLAGARGKTEAARTTRRAQDLTDAMTSADNARRAYATARTLFDRAIEGAGRLRTQADAADRSIEGADRLAQSVAALLSGSPVKLSLSPAMTDARRKAADTLGAARDKVAAAKASRLESDLAEARRLADDAEALFERVYAGVEDLRKTLIDAEVRALKGRTAEGFKGLDARVADIRTVMAEHPPAAETAARIASELETTESSISRARRTFDQAIGAADVVAARAAAKRVADAAVQLDTLRALLGGPAPALIPDALKGAAQAFFEARYQIVIRTLPDATLASMPPPFNVHAHVLRAASRYALFEYSGGRDESLRSAAHHDAEAARNLDPAFTPNPSAFAPKFLAFFAGDDAAR